MTFRSKLTLLLTLTSVAAAGLMAWGATLYARREFDQRSRERSDALIAQFQHELAQRSDEVASSVQAIADAEGTLRMALDISRPQADPSVYANDARGLATSRQLDFLELAGDDGALISSAQWPARIGYKEDWVTKEPNWNQRGAFLARVELPNSVELALLSVRVVRVGDKNLYIVGGQRFDPDFLRPFALPPGMRALLYRNLQAAFVPAAVAGPDGPVAQADRFASLIESAVKQPRPTGSTITWTADPASAEKFVALPLTGCDKASQAILLIGSAQRELVTQIDQIRVLALGVAGAGVLFSLLIGWWVSARVTRPLGRLTAGAREVAAGQWGFRVKVGSRDEAGRFARAFNDMTRQLAEQRARLVASERVAAWREVALRLEHELKDSLFPLQVAADNLGRTREQSPERFDEVFFESMTILRAELENLRATAARFGDFAKMPAPRLQAVNVNDALRSIVKRCEPEFVAIGRPPINPELYLDASAGSIHADPVLLQLALETLLLRSLDTMPAGGTLTIRTVRNKRAVGIEIADTGTGLQSEECARMFTPFYATTHRAAGLGLAAVQSLVNDLGGKISAESAPGAGTTFRIEFPAALMLAKPPASPGSDTTPLKPDGGRPEPRPAETPVPTVEGK